jgi:hypothetical protein
MFDELIPGLQVPLGQTLKVFPFLLRSQGPGKGAGISHPQGENMKQEQTG